MPQPKTKTTESRPIEKTPSSKAIERGQQERWTRYIIIAVVIALMLIVLGFFYYREYVAPFQRTVITVDNIPITMGQFLKRTKLAGSDPMAMLEVLTNEQLIRLGAPQYVGEASPEDVTQQLKEVARGGSETISDGEFKEWYRQQLNETGLSDAEYREIATTSLMAGRLQEYLAERIPTVAEQVHLYVIILETYEDAEKIRARWEAGEDFTDLAQEASLDEVSAENGGELGWFPSGVLVYVLDYTAFNLNPGEVSQPLPYTPDPSTTDPIFYLIMVSEKAAARELNDNSLQTLRSKVLQDWLLEEIALHEVKYNFNSEIYAWMNWQLSKQAGKN